jgi:hypothetical protein
MNENGANGPFVRLGFLIQISIARPMKRDWKSR